MVQVINNFLNNDEFHSIYQLITGVNFPWYLQQSIVFNDNNQTQFTHNLVKKSKDETKTSFYITPILSPLLRELKAKDVIRSKINLTYRTNKVIEILPPTDVSKIDLNEPSKTAILYMNTNNGYTQIVGGEKIDSIQNRLVMFPTNTSHFEVTHTDIEYRMVLNLVYKTEIDGKIKNLV